MQERLQKIVAAAGIASRRKAEELIRKGRVSVNDQTVTQLGTKVDPQKDRIKVDGRPIRAEPLEYFMVNKPQGVLSAVSDPSKRPPGDGPGALAKETVSGGETRLSKRRLDDSHQ